MKKSVIKNALLICLIAALSAFCFLPSYSASTGAEASVSGDSFLRGGSEYTVLYSVTGVDCCGFQGSVSADSESITIKSATALLQGWTAEIKSSGDFLVYSNNPGDAEFDYVGEGAVFSVTFVVKEDVQIKSGVSFSFNNVVASDAEKDISIPDASFEKTVDAPESSVASLSTLLVNGLAITPAFSPDILEYNITSGVEFDTKSLDIIVATSDEMATYVITGNDLVVGNNTVRITVTAENGETKEYTITVRKNHDSTQEESGDARLSSITLSSGTLSPTFSPDVYEYIVYLPHECKSLTITATPFNVFAREVKGASGAVENGLNEFTVTCQAENTTFAYYKIKAYVMPEYIGFIPDIINALPLKGELLIGGELTTGSTLTAYIPEVPEKAYTVSWYKDGVKTSDGSTYIISVEDRGHMISARADASDVYYGSISSSGFYMPLSGEGVPGDVYVPNDKLDTNMLIIIATVAAALFFAVGIIIGGLRKINK